MPLLAAVEGGGTTWVVAIARDRPENVIERAEFPTTSPDETLGACAEWLAARQYDALGIASFGPVDLRPGSKTYGFITTTPKPGWQYVDVLGRFRAIRPEAPCGFDTDVNAPALAEYLHMTKQAASKGSEPPSSCCYITVGTGVGVGLVINGAPVHGLMHPEGGHVAVPRRAIDLSFEGSNPKDCFGGSCAENMCCSIALAKRAGLSSTSELTHLSDDHEVWDAAAHYIGAMCANIVLLASPERIVLSGGVMLRKILFSKIRLAVQVCAVTILAVCTRLVHYQLPPHLDFFLHAQAQLNGYIQMPQLTTQTGSLASRDSHGTSFTFSYSPCKLTRYLRHLVV